MLAYLGEFFSVLRLRVGDLSASGKVETIGAHPAHTPLNSNVNETVPTLTFAFHM